MASKKFFVDLELNRNALKSAVVENVDVSTITSPSSGLIAFDTVSSKLNYYNGSSWVSLSAPASLSGVVTYKGSLAFNAAAPVSPSTGDLYVFTSSGIAVNFGSAPVESGDFIIYNGTTWDIIQGNTSIGPATDAGAGLVELATDSEVIAGTDTSLAITPAGLSAWANQSNFSIVRKAIFTAQNISTTVLNLTHSFGSDASVTVYNSSNEKIEVGVTVTSGNVALVANSTISGCKVIIEG